MNVSSHIYARASQNLYRGDADCCRSWVDHPRVLVECVVVWKTRQMVRVRIFKTLTCFGIWNRWFESFSRATTGNYLIPHLTENSFYRLLRCVVSLSQRTKLKYELICLSLPVWKGGLTINYRRAANRLTPANNELIWLVSFIQTFLLYTKLRSRNAYKYTSYFFLGQLLLWS